MEYRFLDPNLERKSLEHKGDSWIWDREYSPEMWNNPDIEGQLRKQGHIVKNWKIRYFILQHNKMFYFKTKPNKVPSKIPRKL